MGQGLAQMMVHHRETIKGWVQIDATFARNLVVCLKQVGSSLPCQILIVMVTFAFNRFFYRDIVQNLLK